MMRKSFLFMFLCLQFFIAGAQNISVKGKVLDEQGESLIGATIMLKDAQGDDFVGTVTDIDGNFNINVPDKSTLIISFIGLQTKEVLVSGTKALVVKLESDRSKIEEVVVVGFGSQKKETVVGSIAQAKGEDLVRSGGVTNVTEALTGRLPGVMVQQSSSQPGDATTDILIRGRSTWNVNSPLILVDGIEREFDQIDPNEIQSVSVLKDASATAVFGVKGANGVILITTKRGKEKAATLNFSANFGVKQMTSDYSRPDHYKAMELFNEALMNDGDWDNLYTQNEINNWKNKVDPYFYPEIDWSDVLLRDFGSSQNYNLNISGGSKFMRYFTSLGFTNEGDIFKSEEQPEYDPRFSYQRYNFRSNFDFSLSKSTELSVNVSGIVGNQRRPGGVGAGNNDYSKNEFFRDVYNTPGYLYPLRYENGQIADDPALQHTNMLVRLNHSGSDLDRTTNLFSDITLKQDLDFITKGLSVKGKISYNTKVKHRKEINKTVPRYFYDSREDYENGIYTLIPDMEFVEKPASVKSENQVQNVRDLYYEFSANYDKTINDDHTISLLGLMFRREVTNGVQFPAFEQSYVGRATYNYKSKYFAEFNGAYNGSEKFAPGYRMDFFPSGAVGWMISEEDFIQDNLSFIDKLKLRYSYGQVGNDNGIGRFAYFESYAIEGIKDVHYVQFGDPVLNNFTSFYIEDGVPNPLATWETATKQNIGVELDLFGKISLTTDFYNEKRVDIFAEVLVPSYMGINKDIKGNVGETKTQGFEIDATWRDNIGTNFKYWVNGTAAFAENRIIKRSDAVNALDYQKDAGKPIGWSKRLLSDGYYQSWNDIYNSPVSTWGPDFRIPGDLKYVDYNGDGLVNDDDKVPMEHLTIPNWNFGLSFGFSYKNFSLSAMLYGVSDVYKTMPGSMLWGFQQGLTMIHPHTEGRWTPENNLNPSQPALHLVQNNTHNQQASEYDYRDARYIRLKNVELSYKLKKKTAEKLFNMQKLEFYVNGNNLFTITDFDDRMDPEQGSTNLYPIVRRFNAGFRIGF